MAPGDDKPRGEDSAAKGGDKDRPIDQSSEQLSGKPSGKPAGGSGLDHRTDPFDEESPVKRKAERKDRAAPERKQPRRSSPASEDVDPEPEASRRSRFGFRKRRRETEGSDEGGSGRRVASLSGDELPRDDDDDLADLPEPPRFRRPPWWALVAGLVLLLIVSSALYGEFNTERYFLVCQGSKAAAHRGRGFPWPFGHNAMVGSQYRPVPLGGDAQCQTQEFDSESELRHALLRLLLVEAERLSHKTRSRDLAKARRMISQGTLLAKNYKKERLRLEALRGTLDFGQARVVMRELETTLGEARRLFTRSQKQSKQYAKESAAWIGLLDRMLGQLRRRVAGDPVPPKRVGTPAVPVRPGSSMTVVPRPVPPVSGGVTLDAMKPDPVPPPRRASPLAPADAGVSGGGILL